MNNSVILVDKPAGMTSFGVVARIRRLISQDPFYVGSKKPKVGHTGTLDPFATGLMIIVTGKECKNAGNYSKMDKVYDATIVLGKTSSTGDPEGELTDTSDKIPTREEILATIEKFKGEITQIPPIFSAIKINGQRAYSLAREGKTVEMPERKVTIFDLQMLNYDYPYLSIRAHVSSGTYIRTLAEDIGKTLQTGAYCVELRRIKIADWDIEKAITLSSLGINN